MATKKKTEQLPEHEVWAEKLMNEAIKNFGIKSKSFQWKIRYSNEQEVCDWSFELEKGTIKGGYIFGGTYQDCALSLATGIGLEMHPFRDQIIALLNYIRTVSLQDKERNSLGELIVRGYIWFVLTKKVPRDVAMTQILHDWRIKDNIDETYRAYTQWKSSQNAKPRVVGKTN